MSNIGSWALAAASNNATPPNGWPEGQAPSTVNNCAREMMSAIRTQWDDAVWFNFYPTTTPVNHISLKAQNKIRISNQSAATTYTATDIYPVGTRLKVNNSNTNKYGSVISLSSSSTAVILTMAMDSGTLTSTITTVSRSIITPGATSSPIPATIGSYQLISTQSASSSASIDFTGLSSAYRAYKIIIANVIPGTDTVELNFLTSANNGSSYDTGASDYGWVWQFTNFATGPVPTYTGDNADARINLFNNLGTNTDEKLSFELTLFTPSAATQMYMTFSGIVRANDGGLYYIDGGGARLSAAAVNAVRFITSSGNIASGSFSLYGIRA